MKKSVLALAALFLPASVMAQNAFTGRWKEDINNNMQLPQKPMEVDLSGGTYSCKTFVPPYSVPADGKDHSVAGRLILTPQPSA